MTPHEQIEYDLSTLLDIQLQKLTSNILEATNMITQDEVKQKVDSNSVMYNDFIDKQLRGSELDVGDLVMVDLCYNFSMDPGIPDGKATQTTIPNTTAFQNEDLDAYDSDCDDVSNANAVLMDNLSNYGSYVILEVPHFKTYHTDMDNQSVHATQGFKQTPVVDFIDNEITSDSNIIPYSQYLQETQPAAV
ncbi:hypothetical protein Tco_0005410 [Tanacetum coccineum]